MPSKIEKFAFGGNIIHNLTSLEKQNDAWLITVSPAHDDSTPKSFRFQQAQEKYEQDLTENGESIAFPLSIIGFDSKPLPSGLWEFCLNASDIEWGFISKWPEPA